MANIYNAVYSCAPEEIVVMVDGDDQLIGKDVLTKLNIIYQNKDIWLTYGQFKWSINGQEGLCKPFPSEIITYNLFRNYIWISSHLKTFYAGLFHKIRKKDCMYKGSFLSISSDCAFMIPMLEMAQERHYFLREIVYQYNCQNPLSDAFHLQEQINMEKYIKRKKRYQRLDDLPEIYTSIN